MANEIQWKILCDFWHEKISHEPLQQIFFEETWVSDHVLGLKDIDGEKACTLPSPYLQ